MKYLLIISLVAFQSLPVQAQSIARNDVAPAVSHIDVAAPAAVSGVVEEPSYSVNLIRDKKNSAFEIFSPKADRAEVKLMNDAGSEVCLIHKGAIKEGKNLFTVKSRKLHRGIYYVVSKLSSGEQFADRIVVAK